jgi:hypothetical protein
VGTRISAGKTAAEPLHAILRFGSLVVHAVHG